MQRVLNTSGPDGAGTGSDELKSGSSWWGVVDYVLVGSCAVLWVLAVLAAALVFISDSEVMLEASSGPSPPAMSEMTASGYNGEIVLISRSESDENELSTATAGDLDATSSVSENQAGDDAAPDSTSLGGATRRTDDDKQGTHGHVPKECPPPIVVQPNTTFSEMICLAVAMAVPHVMELEVEPADPRLVDRVVIIMDTRENLLADFTLRHTLAQLGCLAGEKCLWALQIFGSAANLSLHRSRFKGPQWRHVVYTALEDMGYRSGGTSSDRMNRVKFMVTRQFWELVVAEHVLVVQDHTLTLRGTIEAQDRERWEMYLSKFDYVGAPWKKTFVPPMSPHGGNGGFSLRTRSVMIKVSQPISSACTSANILDEVACSFEPSRRAYDGHVLPEDQCMADAVHRWNASRVNSKEEGMRFAVETIFYPTPLGAHGLKHQPPKRVRELLNKSHFYAAFGCKLEMKEVHSATAAREQRRRGRDNWRPYVEEHPHAYLHGCLQESIVM